MDTLVDAAAPPIACRSIRWIGFKTIVIREYGRIIRIWGQTIVPSAVTATLYFVIFGSLIGRRVGAMGGFDYMQYIAPGPDHDVGHHELVRERRCRRSSARSSASTSRRCWSRRCRTGSSCRATSRAAWSAGCWSARR